MPNVKMTANFPGLVKLLAEHLYPERSVFLREMVQNAHDSLVRRRVAEPGHTGRIDILVDEARGTITFLDDGTGMTADEVVRYLTVLGESGTDECRKRMAAEGRHGVEDMIGQFGIGLLSGFLVADRITVDTRSRAGAGPVRWTYDGGADSALEELAECDLGIGTRVVLRIRPEYRHFLQAQVVHDGLVRHAEFLPVPVHLNRGPDPINVMHAPWHRAFPIDELRVREYTRFVQRRFDDTPLEVIPIDIASPARVQGVLYISDRRIPDASTAGALDLYCKRMYVRGGDSTVLPPWAKFVRGVIDSPDLSITASRSDVQRESATFRSIQDSLAALLLGHLRDLATRDPQHFQKVMRWHHYHVRGAAVEHDEFFRAVADLVPFETSDGRDGGLLDLRRYLARQAADTSGRRPIYYFTELGAAAQFNEMCRARSIVVIDASYTFDEPFLKKYAESRPDQVELRLLDGGGGAWLFDAADERESARFGALVREYHRLLNQDGKRAVRATAERFFPTDLPAVVTLAERGEVRRRLADFREHPIFGAGMAEFAAEAAQAIETEPLVLHINVQNPLAHRLAAAVGGDGLEPLLIALYNNAMLLSNQLQSERNLKALYHQTVRLVESALDAREERARFERDLERERTARLGEAKKAATPLVDVLRDRLTPDALAAVLRHYADAAALLAESEAGFVRRTGLDATVFAQVRARLARERGGL